MAINVDEFLGAINNLIDNSIKNTAIDLTIDGEVSTVHNVETGEYKIAYQGNVFSAFSLDPLVVYRSGESVYVLVPQGDFSNKKIILGRSAYENNPSYADRNDMTNYYINRGPNWLDDWYKMSRTSLEITSIPETLPAIMNKSNLIHPPANWEDIGFQRQAPSDLEDKVRYPASYQGLSELAEADENLQRYAAEHEFIRIQADFRTEFNMTHSTGQYGVRVRCLEKNPLFVEEDNPNYDPAEPEYRIAVFDLSFSSFIGAPYQYIVDTTNIGTFQVAKGSIKGLLSISLYQDGNLEGDITPTYTDTGTIEWDILNTTVDTNNIFVKNISIHFADKVNLTDTLYRGWIETPLGDVVYDANVKDTANYDPSYPERPIGKGSVELVAHIYYGYEDITSVDTCRIYWFKEKYDMTVEKPTPEDKDEHNMTYYDYAGPGWIPIEKLSEDEQQYYTVNFDRLTVRKGAIPWQWRYKAVIVYNNTTTVSEIQTITNLSSPYDLSLEKVISADLKKTLLRIVDNRDTVLYKLETELNQLKQIANPSAEQLTQQKTLEAQILNITEHTYLNVPQREWFGTWWLLLQDGSYKQISTAYHHGDLEINEYLINDIATFKVQCYAPEMVDPAGDGTIVHAPEVGNLETVIISSDESSLFITWEGKDTFTYDSNGSVKAWVGDQEKTLYGRLTWLDNAASDYLVEVIAPDGVTVLGDISHYESGSRSGKGYNLDSSMMQDMWVDINNVIHFHVKTKYDQFKTHNTFTLRVTTIKDGVIYNLPKTIFFTKDGDQGTQGSDWIAQIKPTAWRTTADHTAKYVEELQYPAPLVIRDGAQYFGPTGLEYKTFLRPFVSKNGIPVEQMDPFEAYFYEINWDVRFPSNAADKIKNGSFLRLYRTDGTVFPYQTGLTTNPSNYDGLTATTEYIGNIGAGTESDNINDYGAVEVRFAPSIADMTYDEARWNFYVKAQIDIFKGTYDELTHTVTKASAEQVASIHSIYPIDIFFDDSKIDNFNPEYIYTNWVQYVDYNATGYEPTTFQDNLFFKYGEDAHLTTSEALSYPPDNLTPNIQSLKASSYFSGDSIDEQSGIRYYPTPYFYWRDGYNGALSLAADNDLLGGRYVRNQIFRLNNYGNVDINGWDGQGIDINEDEGTLFAPTMGAGYKDPLTNTFTGIVMGIDSSQKKNDWFSTSDINKRDSMVGLYGYQEGVSSFGIMENGTAYFGRADRGGRIIIDGYNATIYGGNNILGTPKISDDMTNTMRLSFVDFDGIDSENIDVNGNTQGFGGDFFGNPAVAERLSDFPAWYTDIRPATRLSATPAIEIGQHPDGTQPAIIGWGEYKTILAQSKIPGNRNFMVTYDGTMWAMNGVFMGNVIGSNIIAGRFQGGEIGIGDQSGYSYEIISSEDSWVDLIAPKSTDAYINTGHSFFVDSAGQVTATNLKLAGGQLDVGSLHITTSGTLVQLGESDFVGPSHFYGNVGIGPDSSNASSHGNLFQVKGQVGLGISVADHKTMGNGELMTTTSYSNLKSKSFFGIDSTGTSPATSGGQYQGHFYPFAFMYQNSSINTSSDRKNAYVTMMDEFRAPLMDSVEENTVLNYIQAADDNYFRVGPYGTESTLLVFRKAWQSANSSTPPTADNSFGIIGKMKSNAAGLAEGQNGFGMWSWGQVPIIFRSDGNLRATATGSLILSATLAGAGSGTMLTENSGYKTYIEMGSQRGSEINGNYTLYTANSRIGSVVYDGAAIDWQEASTAPPPISANDEKYLGGLIIDPLTAGTVLFDKKKTLSIMQGSVTDATKTSGMVFAEQGGVSIGAQKGLWMSAIEQVRLGLASVGVNTPDIPNGIVIRKENVNGADVPTVTFLGELANPEHQFGIYARFS